MKNNSLFKALMAATIFVSATTASWAHFGSKGPFGGTVNTAATYDSTVYIGTLEGGLYESTNSKLVAWRARPVGLHSGRITAIAHSGSYLFVGTEAGAHIFNGFVGSDRHFNRINNGLTNQNIRSLAAVDSITVLAGTSNGLFKTSNKGASWSAVNNASFNNSAITAITKVGRKFVLATLSNGLFISSDNGNTWTSFNDANTLNIGGTISLSYNATTNELAVINNNGLWIAANASTVATPTFAAAQTGLPTGTTLRSISCNASGWYLATNNGVYVAGLNAVSWTSANTGLPTNDVAVVIPFRTSLVAGTSKFGIYKTAAGTVSWVANNTNYNNLTTYALETSGEAFVATATERGIFVSRDLASTYVRANKGLTDSLNVQYLKLAGTTLYAATKNGGVFASADSGKNWVARNAGLAVLNVKKVLASGNSKVYALDNNGGVFELNGNTWTAIQTGLPANVVPTSMAFYGTKLLLGTLGQGVFVREAASGTWAAANTGLSNQNVTSVTTNGTKLFAGTDGAGVFVSDIASVSWSQASPVSISHTTLIGLDGSKIQELAFYAGYIFASYKGGLLASSNNGATWIAGGNQFNLPSYTAVKNITFVTTRVFVSTENNCIYSNALSELPAVTSLKANSQLNAALAVSPNPSKGNFTIQLQGVKAEILAVSIVDNLGKVVKIIEKNQLSENISVSSLLPAGIYFVHISTNEGNAVKKIVIE